MYLLIIEYIYLDHKSYDYFAFSSQLKAKEAIAEYLKKMRNIEFGKINYKIIPLNLNERIP